MPVTARLIRHRRDAGTTLIELLVVIVLMGVVGAIVVTTLTGAMRSTRQTQNRTDANGTVQAQLERIARDVRVADPIRAASATSLTVDVFRGNTCQRQQWSAASGRLTLTTISYAAWAACSVYPATATPVRTTTATVVSALGTGAAAVFSYADAKGNALSASPQASQVGVVTITLIQNVAEGRAPVTYATSVGVRNVALS